mgnify:CR=1 FL=1
MTRLKAFFRAFTAHGRHRKSAAPPSAGEDTAPIRAIRAANPYPQEFR